MNHQDNVSIKKILILGGTGLAGSTLARRLLEESQADIVLAGRNIEKARFAANNLNQAFAGRVSARQADAANLASLNQAFSNIDLVVVAASTLEHTAQVAEAALDAGCDYYDLMMAIPDKLSALEKLQKRMESEGRCFITEGGFFPGLPAAMVRMLAPKFKELQSANCFGLMLEDWRSFNFSGPTMDEMAMALKEVRMEALQEGEWGKVSMLNSKKKYDFGEFGKFSCSVQYYEEIRRLKKIFPSLKQAGVYSFGTNWFCENIFFPLSFIALKIAPKLTMKHFGSAFEWAVKKFQKPPYTTVIELDAKGVGLNNEPVHYRLRVNHEDGYLITGACNLSIVLQWLDGTIAKPGLHLQALVTDPKRLFDDIKYAGALVEIKQV